MTHPTDAAISRAFWEVLAENLDPYDAPDFFRFLRSVKIKAERFDAETGGTDRQAEEVIACYPVVQPERQGVAGAADGKAAAPAVTDDVALLNLIADIRAAAGDKEGRLMQSELVELIARQREECEQTRAAESDQRSK